MTLDVEDRLRRTLHDVASRLEVGDNDLNHVGAAPVASRPRWMPLAIAAVLVLVVGAAAALTGLGVGTDDDASVVAGPGPGVEGSARLRFYEDLTVREVAAALGCRLGTAKSLIHRGTRALKEVLRDDA
ncbi:MAG TPA: sigma factor-like helix-turn-helix DNA-binding protein [Acidimicrobiales bacterium]|nr:sigma factor-like helix-turn-helix DNA-binding protein [Acidimicrobiales bacterium]